MRPEEGKASGCRGRRPPLLPAAERAVLRVQVYIHLGRGRVRFFARDRASSLADLAQPFRRRDKTTEKAGAASTGSFRFAFTKSYH